MPKETDLHDSLAVLWRGFMVVGNSKKHRFSSHPGLARASFVANVPACSNEKKYRERSGAVGMAVEELNFNGICMAAMVFFPWR